MGRFELVSRSSFLLYPETANLTCRSHAELALANVSLKIAPGEKVALCGLSGCGKPSLIMAILRMIELREGQITIDGMDVSMLRGDEIRSRVNIVPQEPFFMPGTIRFNLDPHKRSNDESIEKVIHMVGLQGKITAGVESTGNDSIGI